MKKTFISLSLLLAFNYTMAHAKPRMKTHNIIDNIKFGIAAGTATTDLNYFIEEGGWAINNKDQVISSKLIRKARWGFHTNAFGSYRLSQYLDLALAIEYVAKGNKSTKYIGDTKDYEHIGDNDRYEGELNFNYLQTNVQLNIFPGKDRQFFLVTGIYAGYLLTATKQTQHYIHSQKQGEPEIMNFKENTSTKDKLNNIDIGIALGLGYEFEAGLIWSVNGSTGLRKIIKEDSERRWTNLAGQVSLGYNFAKFLQ